MNEYAVPIKKSLSTPVLIMGTERALLLINFTLCAAFTVATRMHWPVFFVPAIFMILHFICMRISKADPFMIAKFRQSTRFRGFYPASPGMWSIWERKFSSKVGGRYE